MLFIQALHGLLIYLYVTVESDHSNILISKETTRYDNLIKSRNPGVGFMDSGLSSDSALRTPCTHRTLSRCPAYQLQLMNNDSNSIISILLQVNRQLWDITTTTTNNKRFRTIDVMHEREWQFV